MLNERKKQEHAAWRNNIYVYRFHFFCDDGETFSAIAPTENGAFRVLNAERPCMLAQLDGVTTVPARDVETRRLTHDATCNCHKV